MTVTRFRTLVSTAWLRDRVSAVTSRTKSAPLRVLDTSASLDPEVDGYKEFYQISHIPEASYFNLHAVCKPSPSSQIKFAIPDTNCFQDYAESLGINNDTHIVTYDRFNTIFALRTWWLFRLFGHNNVSVMDGGFTKWLSDNYEVTVEEPMVERSTFKPVFNPSLVWDFDSMLQNTTTKSAQVIDSRNKNKFSLINENDTKFCGHIPDSTNTPYSLLFNEDGTFKSPNELSTVFAEAAVSLDKPVVATCQLAMTACGLAAAAHMLGKDIPVYNGSFYEWSQRATPDQIALD